MRRTLRKKTFVVLLLTAAAASGVLLIGSAGSASANGSVTYTQEQDQPIPPAQHYVSSAGGDGYAVALYNGRVYNVFHHQTTLKLDCHVQATANSCWGGSKIITDPNTPGATFHTSVQAGLYIDQSTGKLWVFATRSSDHTAGIVCVDLTLPDTNTDPICGTNGFVPLGAPGDSQFFAADGRSTISSPMLVGSQYFAFSDYPSSPVTGTRNTILCFNVSTDTPCPGQPYAPTLGSGNVGSGNVAADAAIGTQLIIPVGVGGVPKLVCFDTTTLSNCSGAWPVATGVTNGTYGAPYPMLDAAGNPTGVCLPNGTDPCYTLAGASTATPPNMSTAIKGSNYLGNGPALTLGPRIYVANNLTNAVGCYDYFLSAPCSGFPYTLSNLGGLYTVNPDPQRPTCIWVNSDNGTWQIQNFDAYNGGPCTQTRVLATQFVVSGPAQCVPTSYTSLQVLSPTPDQYQGGSVSFADAGGNPIPGLSNVTLDANGTADLTGLTLNTATGLPQFLISLTNAPVNPAPLDVKLTWVGQDDPACKTGGQQTQTTTALDAVLNDGTNTSHDLTEWVGTPVTNNTNGLLTGTNAASATGTVTYHWWSDSSCTTAAAADDTETITTPGTLPPSQPVNLPAGVYYETVDYSGDGLNSASSTTCGSETLTVNQIPTKIVYTGDTNVYAGDPASISFVLYNSITNTVLANQQVTITLPTGLGGGTLTGTTDSNGVFSTGITAPLVSHDTSYGPAEAFFGSGGKYLGSTGTGTLTVHVIPTNITYTGTTSLYAGQTANLSFVLKDNQGNVLANKPVTINLPAAFGGGSVSGNTDGSGVFSTTAVAPFPSSDTSYSVSESYARQGKYLASTGFGTVTVHVIPTNITYTGSTEVIAGQPATISFQLTDNGGNVMPNEPVSITLPDGSPFSGTTDSNGDVSTTITAPMTTGTYYPSESFGGDEPYLSSTGQGTLLVDPIQTSVTYTGDTSVQAGQTANISYVLKDQFGNKLANMPITVNLPFGGTATGTTDSNGVFSTTQAAPMHTGSFPTDESFGGQDPYLASDGPGSIQVTPIPTNIQYIGDPSVVAGHTATVAFLLTDKSGNPLPGETVTINLPFSGTPYTGTTDASGVLSTTDTAPMHTGSYGTTETFAGQDPYTGSSGPGTIQVTPISTSVTYKGDTTVVAGQTATVKYVLKDQYGNVLPGQTVTISLPFGLGPYTGTTDANGLLIDVVTAPMHTGSYGTTETFSGQDPYTSSNGPGTIVVNPIPTKIKYIGDTTVYSGQTATLTFVLTDTSGNLLPAGEPVTINLPGVGSCTGTTDGSGVYSCVVTAPIVSTSTSYTPTESFSGQDPYTGSTGSGSLTVNPIPTNITYTGDTTVTAGSTAHLSFVLKNSITGNVLPGEPVTITLPGGGTVSGTTDTNGVFSTTTAALSAGSYSVSEAFAGQAQYLASNGPGAITVTAPLPPPLDCTTKGVKCESILADPTVVSNTQLSIVATDDASFTGACAPTALLLNNGQQLTVSTSPTSGQPQNYVDNHNGSMSAKNQMLIKINLPSGLGAGQYSVRITACDGDGDKDQWTWTIAVDGSGSVTTVNTGPGQVTCGGAVKCESILADPTVASNTKLTIVAMDDSPIGTSGSTAPSAVLTSGQVLDVSTSATSGQPQNYVDAYKGSTSTKYETLITINLPSGLAAGNYTIRVTAYDGDGDLDQWNWQITVDGSGNVTTTSGSAGGGGTLSSGATACNGVYSGTGQTVSVAAGATCTLLPGTNVTGNVTVAKGGTLVASGVTVGGNLAIQGGAATVCASSIGNDLTAAGAPGAAAAIMVGGTSCAGNTVGHDLNVQNDTGGVSVVGNTVTHDMNVKNDGPTTVVSSNTVTHDANCAGNAGQSGSGNSSGHNNSCPAP